MQSTSRPARASNGLLSLTGFLAATLLVGAIGGYVTATSVESWYPALRKPAFNPPSGVFAPVWTTLYVLMAVAAWRVFRRRAAVPAAKAALGFWTAQLALNLGWSCLFFGLRSPLAAFGEVLVLLAAIAATSTLFWRIDRLAGLLLAPYLAWVAFAAVLNFEIWRLN